MSIEVTVERDDMQPALKALAARLPELAERYARQLAADICRDVASRVPVDTGALQSSWLQLADTLEGGGESGDVSALDGDAAGVLIENPTPYAAAVEYGTATTAPGFQVATAVAAQARPDPAPLVEDVKDAWKDVI